MNLFAMAEEMTAAFLRDRDLFATDADLVRDGRVVAAAVPCAAAGVSPGAFAEAGALVTHELHEFVFAGLAVEPRPGDVIRHGGRAFRVANGPDGRCWECLSRESDQVIRVHAWRDGAGA